MRNPWIDLPVHAPYVLEIDSHIIREMKIRYGGKESEVVLNLLPEPYVGNVKAPIILLSKNPGVSRNDFYWHNREVFKNLLKDNLAQKPTAYPFFHLNPSVNNSPGAKWHSSKLRSLIRDTSLETVARKVCSIPYFPYHVKKFSGIPKAISKSPLPSQRYTAYLVREAIARRAVIIITMYEKPWKALVPELIDYERVYRVKNPQQPTISSGNLVRYEEILERILA